MRHETEVLHDWALCDGCGGWLRVTRGWDEKGEPTESIERCAECEARVRRPRVLPRGKLLR